MKNYEKFKKLLEQHSNSTPRDREDILYRFLGAVEANISYYESSGKRTIPTKDIVACFESACNYQKKENQK
ncbi:hypothetical protein [Bacillus toyonensis]|uniref:hypothetical protein n=1 Tax=Bacillus toyonensis TaxID=155322 RepID=UPI001C01579F|nr:hypothetical protein [Bacillus toyonensis]QWI08422.1 hypothetical protein EXW54_27605 [Bacillus toyonensis]